MPRFNDDPDTIEFTLASDSDSDFDDDARVMERLTSPKSVTDRFKEFLTSLKEIPGPDTNLKFLDVSQSTDSERIECANFLIEMILSTPTMIESYVNVCVVVGQYPVFGTTQVNFPSHVTKLCMVKMEELFNVSKFDWKEIENLGRFFGYLYIMHPVSTYIKFWLEKIQVYVVLHVKEAINSYFAVMHMIADTVKKHDREFYMLYQYHTTIAEDSETEAM